MVRAMLLAFPGEPALSGLHDQYMLGDALLVKPVTRPLEAGGAETEVVLPAGTWYNLFTGAALEGGGAVKVETPLERFPVFARAGSILPMAAEGAVCAAGAAAWELWVFEGRDGAFDLYDDAGDGPAFAEGAHALVPLRYEDASGTLAVGAVQGGMAVDWPLDIRLIRRDGTWNITRARYRGQATELTLNESN